MYDKTIYKLETNKLRSKKSHHVTYFVVWIMCCRISMTCSGFNPVIFGVVKLDKDRVKIIYSYIYFLHIVEDAVVPLVSSIARLYSSRGCEAGLNLLRFTSIAHRERWNWDQTRNIGTVMTSRILNQIVYYNFMELISLGNINASLFLLVQTTQMRD